MDEAQKPRICLLSLLFLVILAGVLGIYEERRGRLAQNLIEEPSLADRQKVIPNYHHVALSQDLVYVNGKGGELCWFGDDFKQSKFNWSILCRMDSDGDGITNGEELGDPCCSWKDFPQSTFDLRNGREYRRWGLKHPAQKQEFNATVLKQWHSAREPESCESFSDATYQRQFQAFYFSGSDSNIEEQPVNVLKVLCLAPLILQFGFWFARKQLAQHICPCFAKNSEVSSCCSFAILIASFVYMDVTSGIVHLILDYLPPHLPVLGGLAGGFQWHHEDPTAIIRISWYEYISHIHFLIPLIVSLNYFSDASSRLRLFWFWASVFAHLFQTAHRWAHFPPAVLPWLVRFTQSSGLLLSHEKHMRHHQDLETQFTILSGHSDVILDGVSRFISPHRYDLWCLVGVAWFLLPTCFDLCFNIGDQAVKSRKRFANRFDMIVLRLCVLLLLLSLKCGVLPVTSKLIQIQSLP